jgi:hypothetical protein
MLGQQSVLPDWAWSGVGSLYEYVYLSALVELAANIILHVTNFLGGWTEPNSLAGTWQQ